MSLDITLVSPCLVCRTTRALDMTRMLDMCDSCPACLAHVRIMSFVSSVPCAIHVCAMCNSCLCHVQFMSVPCAIHVCAMCDSCLACLACASARVVCSTCACARTLDMSRLPYDSFARHDSYARRVRALGTLVSWIGVSMSLYNIRNISL